MAATVVISQPMFFPWVGLFEQIRLCDVYVHYDDVQFSKGSFTSRVQIKTEHGMRWLSVPLRGLHLGQRIADVHSDEGASWRERHLAQLADAYRGAPFCADMLALAADVYRRGGLGVGEIGIASIHAVLEYFDIGAGVSFRRSSELGIGGGQSRRVLDIVKRLGGDRYVTGHGAARYLEHDLFESEGVTVDYMSYECRTYRQLHGEFTPYVSTLDLIANEGVDGRRFIASKTVGWREFLSRAAE